MNFLGDFAEDDTVYIPFNTFSSDDPQASVTITNLVAADIKVHKDGSATEIITDGATVAIDFDTITGNHLITIDTSASADYSIGSDYLVRVEGTTVDAGTINAWVGHFSIENRYKHGVAQTADHTAGIADIPTVAEFNARSLVSADYTIVSDLGTVQTGDSFARIGVAGAGLTNIDLPNQTMDITGSITGNLSGSVGSVVGNVGGSVVGSVGSVTGLVGGMTGTIQTLDTLDTEQDAQHLTTQTAIGNLSVGSGGISAIASAFAKDGAEPETNSYTDTATVGTVHRVEDDGGTTGFYYEFDVGTNGVPQEVNWSGYAASNGDSYLVRFWNWAGSTWDTVANLSGSNGTTLITDTFLATVAHVGTGSDVGKVRLRFESTNGTALGTDRILCTYTQVTSGIANGSTITLSTSVVNQNFIGNNWVLELGGQDISGAYIEGAKLISGTGTATNGDGYRVTDCCFDSPTITTEGRIYYSSFLGAIFTSSTGVTADSMTIVDGSSLVPGSGSPTMTWAAVTKETSINVRGWNGGGTWVFTSDCTASLEVYNGGGHSITTGGGNVEFRGRARSLSIILTGGETVQVIAFCGPISISGVGTGSTVNIYGSHSGVTNSASGSPTVNDDSANATDIGAIKSKTDPMTYTNANELDANTKSINDAEVIGDGSGTPWDGV